MSKYVISLNKNILIPADANTSKGNYDVLKYKAFRKFKTREEARQFKRNYKGNPIVIINTHTQQVVR